MNLLDLLPWTLDSSPISFSDAQGLDQKGKLNFVGLAHHLSSSLASTAAPLFQGIDTNPIPFVKCLGRKQTSEMFVDHLLEEYKKITDQADQIVLFLSAGFDSRFELALLQKANAYKGVNVQILSFAENEEEVEVVRQLAAYSGYKLAVLEPATYTLRGLKSLPLIDILSKYPKWRPTIPAFFAACEEFVSGHRQPAVLGYNPVSFKGRYWSGEYPTRLTITPPSRKLLEIIKVEHADFYKGPMEELRQAELTLAREFDLSKTQVQDSLMFFFVHNRGYMDRIRILSEFFWMASPNSNISAFEIFLELPDFAKFGESLLVNSIQSLDPFLAEIPFISSSNGRSRSYFDYSELIARHFNQIFSSLGEANPNLTLSVSESVSTYQVFNYLDNSESLSLDSEYQGLKREIFRGAASRESKT